MAHFSGDSFDEYWARSASRKARSNIRSSRRRLEDAGVVIVKGNTPELVADLYEVYARWTERRAAARKVPGPIARWQAGRMEPLSKFVSVADAMGKDCQIMVARWDGRPVGAIINLYAGETAIGWRSFSDRSVVPPNFRVFEVLAEDAMREAFETGRRYLEMGESVGSAGLTKIKEQLGGREHQFTEYCFERLPVSPTRMAVQRTRSRAEQWVLSKTTKASQ